VAGLFVAPVGSQQPGCEGGDGLFKLCACEAFVTDDALVAVEGGVAASGELSR
jgi:hypothetical protein